MAGIDGGDAGFKLLPVAAGMQGVPNIIVAKDGKGCDGITDPIIGTSEGLQTDEIIRGRRQFLIQRVEDTTLDSRVRQVAQQTLTLPMLQGASVP